MTKKPPNWKAPDARNPRGRAATGQIASIARGRGDGFIREDRGDRFYFNRRDVPDGSFNALEVGDAVTFEVIEDLVSGHRAVRVARKSSASPD